MKKHTIQALALALMAVVLLGSCDLINDFIAGRTRNIALIQIYNSNHEKTNKLQPNDTLYVEVQGLAPLGYYKVEALDPSNNPITMMTAQADENGVIVPTPLWYDIGFKKVTDDQGNIKAVLPTDSELGLNAFNIHVVSLEEDAKALTMTDFKLPFFVVYKTDINRPQPIVMAGKNVPVNLSSEFVLENAYDSGEELWIKVANLETLLETDDPETTDMTVYLVPFDAGHYEDGYLITSNFVARQTFTVKQLREGVKFSAASETWTGIGAWDPIPASAEGHSFSVILDVDNNGLYDVLKDGTDDFYLDGIDGNGVPGFIVRQTVAPFPNVLYIPGNVASGGISWGHFFFEDWPDPDYRDQFYADGMDTLPVWGWQDYVGWTIDYGIKALWNPYVDKDIDDTPNTDNTLYYGRWVNLYIVESSTLDLTGTLELTPATGTRMLYMPVQYACTNGANLQTIWKAPMAVGKYSVVVDIDMNNKVSKGDLVDNVMENGAINADGKTGFEVIAR